MNNSDARKRWWARLKSDPIRHAEYLAKHRENRNRLARKYREKIKADPVKYAEWLEMHRRINRRKWAALSPEKRKERLEAEKNWARQNPEKHFIQRKRYRERIRTETITRYGGKCACCGETEMKFLQLDHINGDGAVKRKLAGGASGTCYYMKLRKLGWPDGYRVLCANCHQAISFYDGCPHGLPRNIKHSKYG